MELRIKFFPALFYRSQLTGLLHIKWQSGILPMIKTVQVVSLSTIFDIASVTKPIVATVALKLLELEKIKLDSTIGEYLPQLAGTNVGSGITVWNLLTHTSSINLKMASLADEALGKEAFFNALITYNAKLEPGTQVNYANVNTFLLGEITTVVSGIPLDVLVSKEVTEPLEMVDTTFVPSPDITERIVPTEIIDTVIIRGVVHDPSVRGIGGIAGHAGLFSTISDLHNFLTMWTGGGVFKGKRVLAKNIVSQALVNQTPKFNKSSCLGWHLDNPDYLGNLAPRGTFFHPGFTGTIIVGNILRKERVVFLSNCTFPHRENHHIKNEFIKKLFDAIFSS